MAVHVREGGYGDSENGDKTSTGKFRFSEKFSGSKAGKRMNFLVDDYSGHRSP